MNKYHSFTMSIKYSFKENPFKEEDGKQVLYPVVAVKETLDTEKIVESIVQHSAHSRGTLSGVLNELLDEIVERLQNGYNVRIDRLGTFSLLLDSREVTDQSEIRSPSIHIKKVNFRPDADLLKRVRRNATLERAEVSFQSSSKEYTKEERWNRLATYLQQNGSITRVSYSEQMGLARSTAALELKKWADEQRLVREGKHSQVRYSLPKTAD